MRIKFLNFAKNKRIIQGSSYIGQDKECFFRKQTIHSYIFVVIYNGIMVISVRGSQLYAVIGDALSQICAPLQIKNSVI